MLMRDASRLIANRDVFVDERVAIEHSPLKAHRPGRAPHSIGTGPETPLRSARGPTHREVAPRLSHPQLLRNPQPVPARRCRPIRVCWHLCEHSPSRAMRPAPRKGVSYWRLHGPDSNSRMRGVSRYSRYSSRRQHAPLQRGRRDWRVPRESLCCRVDRERTTPREDLISSGH